MIVLIDNYDSFTFNLFHYFGGLGADVAVHRNDKIRSTRWWRSIPMRIVLSPGPCTPNDAGICLDLIDKAARDDPDLRRLSRPPGDRPGLRRRRRARAGAGARQALDDQASGRRRLSRHQRRRSRRRATIRSWSTARPCPTDSKVTAETDDELVMGLAHRALPVHGVQFHPESIASEHGHLHPAAIFSISPRAWNASTGRRRPVTRDAPVLMRGECERRFQGTDRQGCNRRQRSTATRPRAASTS